MGTHDTWWRFVREFFAQPLILPFAVVTALSVTAILYDSCR